MEEFILSKPKRKQDVILVQESIDVINDQEEEEGNKVSEDIFEVETKENKKFVRKRYFDKRETGIKRNTDIENIESCFDHKLIQSLPEGILSKQDDLDWFPLLWSTVEFIYSKANPNCYPKTIDELFDPIIKVNQLLKNPLITNITICWSHYVLKKEENTFPILWMSGLKDPECYDGLGWEYFSSNVKKWLDSLANSEGKYITHIAKDEVATCFLKSKINV